MEGAIILDASENPYYDGVRISQLKVTLIPKYLKLEAECISPNRILTNLFELFQVNERPTNKVTTINEAMEGAVVQRTSETPYTWVIREDGNIS